MLKSKSLNVPICPDFYIHRIQEGNTHVSHVILLPTEIGFFGKTGMVNISYEKMEHYQKCYQHAQLLGVSRKTTLSILKGNLK